MPATPKSTARPTEGAVAEAAPPPVERGDDGIWRYAGTPIEAVGARDITLAETVRARQLGVAGDEPEAVVLSLTEIVGDHRLNWALQAGTRLRGGEEDLFAIPWPVWQERAAEPVDAWLPERDEVGTARQLAVTERDLRFRRHAFEQAVRKRMKLALIASAIGMSRRQIGDALGLSPARIQQFHDAAPDELSDDVERAVADAEMVLGAQRERFDPAAVDRPRGWSIDKFEEVLAEMEDVGLVERDGAELVVTDDGRRLGSRATAARRPKRGRGASTVAAS